MIHSRNARHSQRIGIVGASLVVIGLVLTAAPVVSNAASRRGSASSASARVAGPTFPGTNCPAFPAENVWNTPFTGVTDDANSATWLASMSSSSTNLHPDYGPSGNPRAPYGIPWTVVRKATVFTHVTFQYASESNRRPYPLTVSTPIEGGSDRHALMVDPYRSASSAACTLFETWDTYYHPSNRSTAGSGATWNLRSDSLRPARFTSADASGAMDHAIRFTADCTQESYLWPARHEAGQDNSSCPPMGARFRLNASFTLPASQCSGF